ncbi:MAG TPA: hypothetical protein VGB85_05040, partial [Nannocystis sp.]
MVSDGTVSIKVFCQPCRLKVGDPLSQPLLAFETGGVQKTSDTVPSACATNDRFAHECRGIVTSADLAMICIGEFNVALDVPLPGDVNVGDWVCFECARI